MQSDWRSPAPRVHCCSHPLDELREPRVLRDRSQRQLRRKGSSCEAANTRQTQVLLPLVVTGALLFVALSLGGRE